MYYIQCIIYEGTSVACAFHIRSTLYNLVCFNKDFTFTNCHGGIISLKPKKLVNNLDENSVHHVQQ